MPCRNHPDVMTGLALCDGCRLTYCPNCLVSLRGGRYCASCKAGTVRDVQAGVVTTGLDLASIGRRFVAQFVDGFLFNIVSRVLQFAFFGVAAEVDPASFTLAKFMVFFVVVLALYVAYEASFVAWRGQTLGKMAAKIKVVSADGGDVTFGRAVLRAVTRLVTAPLLGLDYWPAFFTKERTCLHDIVAGTRVIRWGT